MSTRPHEPLYRERRHIHEHAVRPLVTLPETCKKCNGHTFERIPRFGFWQETVLPFFNRYPWRCVACAEMTYRPMRSVRQARAA